MIKMRQIKKFATRINPQNWSNIKKLAQVDEVDYSDQILKSVIKTTYAKKKFNNFFLMLLTILVRLHIDAVLVYLLDFNNVYVNFCVQITISVTLVIKSGWIYGIVQKFDPEMYLLTRYVINNYSEDNCRKWKRNLTFVVCIYLLIYLSFVTITNHQLIVTIVQYLVCYIIIDFIEHNRLEQISNIFKHKNEQITITYTDDFEIIEKYRTISDIYFDKNENITASTKKLSSQSSLHKASEQRILQNSGINVAEPDPIESNHGLNVVESDHGLNVVESDHDLSVVESDHDLSVVESDHDLSVVEIMRPSKKFILTDDFIFNQQQIKSLIDHCEKSQIKLCNV